MGEVRTGGCQCGGVRYEVTGEQKTIVVCHCSECQRQSGSAFGMTMVLGKQQFRLTKGALEVFTWVSDSGAEMHGYFCPDCGSRIYHQNNYPEDAVLLKPGTLDETSELVPELQLWTRSKQQWCKLPESVRSFETQPS